MMVQFYHSVQWIERPFRLSINGAKRGKAQVLTSIMTGQHPKQAGLQADNAGFTMQRDCRMTGVDNHAAVVNHMLPVK